MQNQISLNFVKQLKKLASEYLNDDRLLSLGK